MSIDQRFLIAVAIMASVAYGCRVAGLMIGTFLGESEKLRRFLDILPACAIAAVVGPAFAMMNLPQGLALLSAAGIYLLTDRFLLALISGAAILLCEGWLVRMIG